ncbi:MAG: FAD-binding oxidoreductase [Patescibacteria group bacterium]|nr:FAD-binding oxidoreductase [Patescibacteria group bacterium]
MNKPQQFKGKVSKHILLNEKFHYLHIELIKPNKIEFEAGQFVSIDIGGGTRRSYSIASMPNMTHAIDLCIDITPGGKGSDFFKNLKPGDEVNFLGPMGRLVVALEKKLLFVATGVGITPFKSIILNLLEEKKDKREIKFYWGLRYVEDVFWEEDFRRLHKVYENFEFNLILSKPPKLWPLNAGHVTEFIKDDCKLGSDWGVYLCGNQGMIDDVSKLAKEKGVPKDQVHFERFF